MTNPPITPSPELFFAAMNGFHDTAVLLAALDIELFSAFRGESLSAGELAERCGAALRGVRILADYLTVAGFLTKEGDRYKPTVDTATFLDTASSAYIGGAAEFLTTPRLVEGINRLPEAVRKGATALDADGSMKPEDPMWVTFARAMAPTIMMPAKLTAAALALDDRKPARVLDIAAGHGLFGIMLAAGRPQVEVVAVDWPNVLEVAAENAAAHGLGDRHRRLPGSAFDVDFGEDYDIALLTNFLHHFDPPTCERLLAKVHASLKPAGRAATLEFVPNEDRVSPPMPAQFAVTMLASTTAGDAYTFGELERMAANSGFCRSELRRLEPTFQSLVISHK